MATFMEVWAFARSKQDNLKQPGTVLLPAGQKHSPDWITQRVNEILDRELANGSMPA